MSQQDQLPLEDQPAKAHETCAGPDCALPSGSALQDYAFDVMRKLIAAKDRGFDKDTRPVDLIDLCGAIQLIQAGLPNLRDAERLDQLTHIGAVWQVIVRGQVVGSGNVRAAIDQAIERTLLTK